MLVASASGKVAATTSGEVVASPKWSLAGMGVGGVVGVDDDATVAGVVPAPSPPAPLAAPAPSTPPPASGAGGEGARDAGEAGESGTAWEREGAEVVGLGTEAFLGGIMTTNALSEKSVSSACESARICSRAWI